MEGTNMVGTPQIRELATDDPRLLAYAQHMAETARSEPAKHWFESFVDQERRRLWANGPHQLRKIGHMAWRARTSRATSKPAG